MSESNEMICQKGDVVFLEGDFGSNIYKILSGSVHVVANYGRDGEKVLATLREGEYFGEMAVIEITSRSAAVVAAEDATRLAVVDASDLSGYLNEHKGEINGMAHHLSCRLRNMTAEYTEICNTLRELGRLDTSGDRLDRGLLARIGKFARMHLLGREAELGYAEPAAHFAVQKCGKELALRGAEYRAGDVIFREAAPSDCMYYIYEGRVGIYTGYGTEKQRLLAELTEEMFFGEMGLFDGMQRTATAVALEDHTCVEIIREKDLDVIFEKNPPLAMMILQHLSSRLRKMTVDYLRACGTLAAAEKELAENRSVLTPAMRAQAEYMNQLMLAPELLF